MNLELKEKIKKIALKETIAFCYSCYQEAPAGCCSICHSDDLFKMRRSIALNLQRESRRASEP